MTSPALVERLRDLDPESRSALLRKLDLPAKVRLRWLLQARDKQITPDDHYLCDDPDRCLIVIEEAWDRYPSMHPKAAKLRQNYLAANGHITWAVWMILAGRGWGKTRTGAEDIIKYMLDHPGSRIALVAATFQDGRDTMVEGESGLRGLIPESLELAWNRSLGEVVLKNGSRAKIFSAEEPERLRGPQHHRAWCDEVATWTYRQKTWDMLMFGLRLGTDPKAIITTTPKPYKFIKKMVENSKTPTEGVILTSGHTNENKINLPGTVIKKLEDAYANTRIGRQELAAEVLDDLGDGLIKPEFVEQRRLEIWQVRELGFTGDDWEAFGEALGRIVIGVDPAVTSDETSAETGIVVVGMTKGPCPFCPVSENKRKRPHAVVLEDRSGRYTDAEWATLVVELYRKWQADRVIAEKNNGGDMVGSVMYAVEPGLPVKLVWASRGKVKRAEPVGACYERLEVHHAMWPGANFAKLEDQLYLLGIEEEEDDEPTVSGDDDLVYFDRADACVWALTELMVPEDPPVQLTRVLDTRAVGTR